MATIPMPRSIRSVQNPVGLYFRVGYNDHKTVSAAIATGKRQFSGIVIEAHRLDRHKEVLSSAEAATLECILDPCTQALAMPGGFTESLGELPWGLGHVNRLRDYDTSKLLPLCTSIAKFAVTNRFSEVLAPTHVLSGPEDPWLKVDVQATRGLRAQLDRNGGKRIGLIYALTISYATLRDEAARNQIVDQLEGLPIDALWIRVDPFGDNSTGTAVRNFVDAAHDFHRLGRPLVADQVGGLVGLALVAMSAVGGLAHGITAKERFGASHWRNESESKGFALPHRVYLPALDMLWMPNEVRRLFDSSTMLRSHFGCADPSCCPRGVTDMVENAGLHFLQQRMNQIVTLGQMPDSLRPREFLDRYARPTADAATRFARSSALDDAERKRIVKHRKRLDLLRVALTDLIGTSRAATRSVLPETRAAREFRMER